MLSLPLPPPVRLSASSLLIATPGRLRPVLAMAGSNDSPAAPTRSVTVVGAGVSGLTAACKLTKSDVNVMVFEAADGAGGKMHTNQFRELFLWPLG